MLRKTLKKTSRSAKLKTFLKKYKIPLEYFSTSRKMTSKAVFIGVFIAFIPMPMQMLAVIALVPFIKFNVPIALAMCWFSNPLTMPFMYYIEYLTGTVFFGFEIAPVEMSIEWFSQNIDDIFIPLYAGALFYSASVASLAYWAVNHFWRGSVDKDRKLHRHHRK